MSRGLGDVYKRQILLYDFLGIYIASLIVACERAWIYDLLRIKAVLSSVRGTSAWRTYGASTAQIRLGYGSDKKVSVKRLTLIICIFAIDYGVTRRFRGGW